MEFLSLIATAISTFFGRRKKTDRGSVRLVYIGRVYIVGEDGMQGESCFNSVDLKNESDHIIRVKSFGYKREGLFRRTHTICECPKAIASMEEKQIIVEKPDAIKELDLKEAKLFFIQTERNKIWLTEKDTRTLIEEWIRKPKPYNPVEDEALWTEH